jgi:hypothetical protein
VTSIQGFPYEAYGSKRKQPRDGISGLRISDGR